MGELRHAPHPYLLLCAFGREALPLDAPILPLPSNVYSVSF